MSAKKSHVPLSPEDEKQLSFLYARLTLIDSLMHCLKDYHKLQGKPLKRIRQQPS